LSAIDFNAIRDRVEAYLLSLIPREIEMGYSHDITLSKSVERATQGIFIPARGTKLTVGAKIRLKLEGFAAANVEFSSMGEIGPFDIKLVGGFLDALTLKFASARFEAGSGKDSDMTAVFVDAEIGRDLEFVQKFQKYLSPKPGSGIFVDLSFAPLGIEAGYEMNLGIFSVGAMSVFNVALRTSALLPFENQPALFKAGLSSRKSPFTISYLPFGGSGFFSITANPDGIVGFEASFEYGAAGSFGFGPLSGQGRLMTGIYIRQIKIGGRKLTEISGTFFAGGSASIWIFTFSSSLYVRLGMVNGDMSGEAVFTFAFSMGIRDFEISVTAWRQEGEGFDGAGNQASLPFGRRFAEIGGIAQSSRLLSQSDPQIRSFGVCKGRDWGEFRSYFADTQDPIQGLFANE
jgi:hypothetical protein